MTCYDKLVQQFGPDTSKYTESQVLLILYVHVEPFQMMQFNDRLDQCVAKCADDHIKLIPKIKDRFARSL